jgi:dienelactone hydrolase
MRFHRHGIQRGRAAALATPIALAAGALAMTLCAGAATAQSRASAQRDSATKPDYSAPAGAPYTAENVSVPTPRGYALAGTLTLPRGASRSHPVPAIVTISGTGPQDRDENLGLPGYRPFRQIADSLGRRGIAVLRMDDRGVGQSGGTFKGTTHAEFAEDARAGLAYLRTRHEIDTTRLGLVGHSEGAIDAPLVALEEPSLRALVLLAGNARPLRGAAQSQLENMARHDTALTAAQRDSAVAAVPLLLDSIARVDRYMAAIMAYDPSVTARKVKTPAILILTGQYDKQADPTQVPEWIAAFKASGNPDVSGHVVPDVDHLFVHDTNGYPGDYAKLPQPVHVEPAVIGEIADWLVQRLGTPHDAPASQRIAPPADGAGVLRAMHDRYASTWYNTMSFTEVAEQRSDTGALTTEKWYEEGKLPGRLRIDVGVPATDTVTPHRIIICANDSFYIKTAGHPLVARAGRNLLLVLGFDVYKQPVERSVAALTAEGFDLSRVHDDTWHGRPVIVVGAAAGDSTSKQFWVDAQRMLFVRLLDTSHTLLGASTEARFDDYRRLGGGWIAAEVHVSGNGIVHLREIYSDMRANVTLPDSWFDPGQLR